MSAIAKPFVHFTGAITEDQSIYVPVESIQSVEAIDIPAPANGPASAAEYFILITSLRPNGHTKEIKVRFASSSARNTSLTNFKTAMSTSVA